MTGTRMLNEVTNVRRILYERRCLSVLGLGSLDPEARRLASSFLIDGSQKSFLLTIGAAKYLV